MLSNALEHVNSYSKLKVMNYNTDCRICNNAYMKHQWQSYIKGAYKSCQMQNELFWLT